jgi:hypothetical protein
MVQPVEFCVSVRSTPKVLSEVCICSTYFSVGSIIACTGAVNNDRFNPSNYRSYISLYLKGTLFSLTFSFTKLSK